MASSNGVGASASEPIQLGHFLPEQRSVVINGETYLAWVAANRRYPRKVMVRLDSLSREYARIIAPLLEPDVEIPSTATGPEMVNALNRHSAQRERRLMADDAQQEAYNSYITQALCQLIPTLLESEAELIPLETAEQLLRDLGFFRPVGVAAPAEEEATQEKEPTPLTGATSRGGSRTTTPATQTNAS